ncbi:MAG: YihY/virulence factor BrkB family protein [Ilumatobacteraceae bacterium]
MGKEPWTEHSKVRHVRRRSPRIDLAVRVLANSREHRTARNATLVAHFGFLSVFPLLLVFTTILGFVLESYPKLRESIIDSAFNRIPFVGKQVRDDPTQLKGNTVVLIVGLLLALWAGMRAFNALQLALDDVAEVPLDERPNLFRTRARSLLGIAIVGGAQIGTAVLTGFVGVTGVRALHKVLFAVAAIVVNSAVLAASYRWLCVRRQSWREVAPGALVAGVAFAALQLTGTAVVGRAISRASPVYGDFATVIGLMTYLSLHAMVALMGAELNHALPVRRDAPPQASTT